MKPGFAVVGLGVTEVGRVGNSVLQLEVEAARRAIADAGLKSADIGAAIQMLSDVGGAVRARHDDSFARCLNLPVNVYFENVGRGGEYAAMAITVATRLIELGVANYVVCSGARDDWTRSRRMKEAEGRRGAPHYDKEGGWAKYFGGDFAPAFHAMFATRHMHEFGTRSDQLGHIAVAARRWAQLNPEAVYHDRPITLEDHQRSPIVCWPYHLLDCCVQSDGGVAFVVTTAERARDLTDHPVLIAGVGFGEQMSDLWWEKSNYSQLSIEKAKDAAFDQAGVNVADFDVVQLYDCFTSEVLLQLEGYGWCSQGEGGDFVESTDLGPGGVLPVNTGGGLLSAYHLGNLTGFAEAVRQLRGEGGDRQVADAQIGLVSGHGGEILSGQMCSIHSSIVLKRG